MANLLIEKRDIEFVLYEQFNIEKLKRTEKFAHCSKEDFDMIIEQAVKFSENVLAPVNKEGDETGAKWDNGKVTLLPSVCNALNQFAEEGWVSMSEELEAGGQELPMVIYSACYETFFAANVSVTSYSILAHGAGRMIELFGTEEQKKDTWKSFIRLNGAEQCALPNLMREAICFQ